MATTEPIRDKQSIRKLAQYYLDKGNYRNYVLIVMCLHTALRISDLLQLTWDTLYDNHKNRMRSEIQLVENKTGKSKRIALNKNIIHAISLYASKASEHGKYLFENPRTRRPISRIQAYRIIKAAAEALDIGRISCHSLRKTFGYHAWKSGVSPAILVDIYNHSSLSVTRRYLGITQDEKNEVYLNLNLSISSVLPTIKV